MNKFGPVAVDNDWGVISALSKFFKDKGVTLHVHSRLQNLTVIQVTAKEEQAPGKIGCRWIYAEA